MYSDARSRMVGIVHSPLAELSGVGGGRDPIVGVMPAEAGGTNPPITGAPELRLVCAP